MKDIELFINESIYDQLGNDMKTGDKVIFYYEDGIAGEDDKTKTPRLYRGTLKSWDSQKLEGDISTQDFDQTNYNVPKSVKVHQHLIIKFDW
jgi:hypothetical protein